MRICLLNNKTKGDSEQLFRARMAKHKKRDVRERVIGARMHGSFYTACGVLLQHIACDIRERLIRARMNGSFHIACGVLLINIACWLFDLAL